jgi:flagellar biosynthesis protein FlhF
VKIYTFIADSAPQAVAQIRSQLGPEAVVLNVRKVEATGIGKLWKKPQIEVLAHLPAAPEPVADPLQALTDLRRDLRREIADLKQQMPLAHKPEPISAPVVIPEAPVSRIDYGEWKVGGFLEQTGVLPRNVQRILDEIESEHGCKAPEALTKQFDLARAAILKLASFSSRNVDAQTHIFIGSPGAGKTTVLSKILAQHVLIKNLPARVFRLDGLRANTAESLSVYCEILGVPIERFRTDASSSRCTETYFVDLPGVSANDSEGLKNLAAQIAAFPGAQIHLTLNAAYETNTLLTQLRAFSAFPLSDLVFTHLDEEQKGGKLLNFCFGNKYPIAYFSAGQNVPGDLVVASVQKIVSRVIPSK